MIERERLLSDAVERLRGARRTFTEEDALSEVWAAGYEVPASSDSRFALAREADGRSKRQWRLAEHLLANDLLTEALRVGTWDGRGLDERLTLLDEVHGGHHVFCVGDPQFVLLPGDSVELAEGERDVELSDEAREVLDGHGEALLAAWRSDSAEPRTLRRLTHALGELGWADAEKQESWLLVRAWLLTRADVLRVGIDYWVPADSVPSRPKRSSLRVRAVVDRSEPQSSLDPAQPAPSAAGGAVVEQATRSADDFVVPGGEPETGRASWSLPLRTVHLICGFVPVAPKAREFYPQPPGGAETVSVLRGRWVEDGDQLWLWLDRERNRLFGPELANKLEWREAGEILHVEWAPDVIVFRLEGSDDEVRREETRLVDLDELAALRGGLGEAYREAIQAVLEAASDGLTFRELVAAVRERQKHQAHRGSLRAVLYAGGFRLHNGRWMAAVNPQESARHLRRFVVETVVRDPQVPNSPQTGSHVQAIGCRLRELVGQLREIRPARNSEE